MSEQDNNAILGIQRAKVNQQNILHGKMSTPKCVYV